MEDIVNSSMKNRSGTYGKTRETLPLEGGGKRVGVKERERSHSYPSPCSSPPRGEREIIFDNTNPT
jgi:hypothetical protein